MNPTGVISLVKNFGIFTEEGHQREPFTWTSQLQSRNMDILLYKLHAVCVFLLPLDVNNKGAHVPGLRSHQLPLYGYSYENNTVLYGYILVQYPSMKPSGFTLLKGQIYLY